MERFVFDRSRTRWLSTILATLSGVAIYFFGAPFATLIYVAIAELTVISLLEGWYRKHRGHP